MPEIPNWLAWVMVAVTSVSSIGGLVSFGWTLWQAHRASNQEMAFRVLLASWSTWVETIHRQTINYRLEPPIDERESLTAAQTIIDGMDLHTRQLAKAIARVAAPEHPLQELTKSAAEISVEQE